MVSGPDFGLFRISNRTSAIAFIAGLILLVVQTAALVHAAEHPFHIDDEICAAFSSFDQNNHALAVLPQSCEKSARNGETNSRSIQLYIPHTFLYQQARAPPLPT
jgi:hypothetical protein